MFISDIRVNVGRQLLNEVCENYLQSGISNHEQTDIQNNCSTLHPTNINPSSGNDLIFFLILKYYCSFHNGLICKKSHVATGYIMKNISITY